MPHDVIMPALGMAQETGLIVAWRKAPGDKVAAGDVLMEVETDKATMEVEAQSDGYLTDVRRSEGEEVPVGEAIAIISETAEAAPKQPAEKAAAETVESGPEQVPAAEEKAVPERETPIVPEPKSAKPLSVNGKVLASPKARRISAEPGLDLARLVRAGRPQPYHVADLEHLAVVPSGGGPRDRLEACVAAAAFDDFLAFVAAETGKPADRPGVLSAFAAASLRMAGDVPDGAVAIAVECTPSQDQVLYADPDLYKLAAVVPAPTGTPALVLRDLTGTRLSAMQCASDDLPALSVARHGHDCIVSLDYAAGALDNAVAIMLVSEMAARLNDPLRHLL